MKYYCYPKFSRFPPEVRCRIWAFALAQPRVHRLRIGPGIGDKSESFELYPTETLSRSTITTRTILATCVESRIEAMRAFPDTLLLARGCILRFNKDEDVICLAQLDTKAVEEVTGTFTGSPPPRDELSKVASVQNLAIEIRNTSFIYAEYGDELGPLPQFLAAFQGLERLFLVARPLLADPETVSSPPRQGPEWVDQRFDEEDRSSLGDVEEREDSMLQSELDYEQPDSGDWLRGENGLGDWYRWVSGYATFHMTEIEISHFCETWAKATTLEEKLQDPDETFALTNHEKKRLASVRVEVMIHFREGVEPICDL